MQFNEPKQAEAIALLETLAWGDVDQAITALETALALAIEATGTAIQLWEEEGEERFGDEFALDATEVAALDDEWRLAYIARLLRTAAGAYGVYMAPDAPPARPDDEVAGPPLAWNDHSGTIARLLRGLNDILWGLPPAT